MLDVVRIENEYRGITTNSTMDTPDRPHRVGARLPQQCRLQRLGVGRPAQRLPARVGAKGIGAPWVFSGFARDRTIPICSARARIQGQEIYKNMDLAFLDRSFAPISEGTRVHIDRQVPRQWRPMGRSSLPMGEVTYNNCLHQTGDKPCLFASLRKL